jgi:hypothetical protein
MAAQVDVVISAIDKTQGTLREFGQGWKSLGATMGIAAGIIAGANMALDNVEKRLGDLGFDAAVSQIEEAQGAWQTLADTLLVGFTQSNIFEGMIKGLKDAGNAATQLLFILQITATESQKMLGIISEEEAQRNKLIIAQNHSLAAEKSQTAQAKEKNKALDQQLQKYEAINDALEEGIRKRDPAAIRKAEKDRGAFMSENPNFVSPAKGGATVTIIGGGMKDVVTEVIIDGLKYNFARDTDKSPSR